MTKPLLTILVCTYNRAERARTQLSYVLPVVDELGGLVELVASNNASSDHTLDVVKSFSSPNYRYLDQAVHLPTGEEHIYSAIRECKGEFVWTLGDDDTPQLSTIRALPEILSGGADFHLFNSFYGDGHGGLAGGRLIQINTDRLEGEFAKSATALGFISTLPGASNAIFRREPAMAAEWRDIRDVSPFYSHVVWWFRAFAGKKLAILNRPLVYYRVESIPLLRMHFDRVTAKMGRGSLHPWGLGLVGLLQLLEREKLLSADQIRDIWEWERDGSSFRLIDNLIHMCHEQLKLSAYPGLEQDVYGREQFESVLKWLVRMDPGYFELGKILELGFEARYLAPEDKDLRLTWVHADFWATLNQKKVTSNQWLGHEESYRSFDIYRHRFRSVAFKQDVAIDRRKYLHWLDPQPIEGEVAVALDSEAVKREIDGYWDRVRARVLQGPVAGVAAP